MSDGEGLSALSVDETGRINVISGCCCGCTSALLRVCNGTREDEAEEEELCRRIFDELSEFGGGGGN